jgi:hypothetical protein
MKTWTDKESARISKLVHEKRMHPRDAIAQVLDERDKKEKEGKK